MPTMNPFKERANPIETCMLSWQAMTPKPYDKRYALELFCRENGLEHENVVYIGDDYGYGGNDESVYVSDFPYLTIDDYRLFPETVSVLL